MSASYIIDPIVYQQLGELKTTKSRYHFNFLSFRICFACKNVSNSNKNSSGSSYFE